MLLFCWFIQPFQFIAKGHKAGTHCEQVYGAFWKLNVNILRMVSWQVCVFVCLCVCMCVRVCAVREFWLLLRIYVYNSPVKHDFIFTSLWHIRIAEVYRLHISREQVTGIGNRNSGDAEGITLIPCPEILSAT